MCAVVCSGDCEACPNADLPIGERTFKDDTENSTDPCRSCTICGGMNQDGTQYELNRCTETSDTVCQDCEPCMGGAVRIGCSGTNPGSCVTIAEGVTTVLATKALTLPEGPITEPVAMELGGAYTGVGLNIPVGSVLTWPNSGRESREISASAIEPSLKMSVASSKLSFEIYFGPSGLQFNRPITLKLSVSEQVINQLVTMQFRLAVVRWYEQEETWKEISNAELVDSLVLVEHNHFSMYTAVAIPIQSTISAAPVIVTSTTDISARPTPASSAPTGPLNQPDEPQEKPNVISTAILLSVLGAIVALVLTVVGCWCMRHPKNLQGLPSYLTPPGMGARVPQGFEYTQSPGQAAIESKILGAPDLLPGSAMVRMPAPFSAAQQTQPSLQQLGGLAAPMSSASMSILDGQWNGGVLEPRASADLAGAGVFAQREDGLQQGKAVSRQLVATAPQSMAETRINALSDTTQKGTDQALQARLVPFGISPSSTPGVLPLLLPSPAFAAVQQPMPVSARPAAPSASTGVSSPQSQISAQSGRHSDTGLDDLDYDSTDNESSWGENESSDGENEGPALTQADLTALLAGVAAAENLSSVYIEPEASNMFAGFEQYSAGETPYTPASGATSPSGRSRASNARSNQGVPLSAAATITVS